MPHPLKQSEQEAREWAKKHHPSVKRALENGGSTLIKDGEVGYLWFGPETGAIVFADAFYRREVLKEYHEPFAEVPLVDWPLSFDLNGWHFVKDGVHADGRQAIYRRDLEYEK